MYVAPAQRPASAVELARSGRRADERTGPLPAHRLMSYGMSHPRAGRRGVPERDTLAAQNPSDSARAQLRVLLEALQRDPDRALRALRGYRPRLQDRPLLAHLDAAVRDLAARRAVEGLTVGARRFLSATQIVPELYLGVVNLDNPDGTMTVHLWPAGLEIGRPMSHLIDVKGELLFGVDEAPNLTMACGHKPELGAFRGTATQLFRGRAESMMGGGGSYRCAGCFDPAEREPDRWPELAHRLDLFAWTPENHQRALAAARDALPGAFGVGEVSFDLLQIPARAGVRELLLDIATEFALADANGLLQRHVDRRLERPEPGYYDDEWQTEPEPRMRRVFPPDEEDWRELIREIYREADLDRDMGSLGVKFTDLVRERVQPERLRNF